MAAPCRTVTPDRGSSRASRKTAQKRCAIGAAIFGASPGEARTSPAQRGDVTLLTQHEIRGLEHDVFVRALDRSEEVVGDVPTILWIRAASVVETGDSAATESPHGVEPLDLALSMIELGSDGERRRQLVVLETAAEQVQRSERQVAKHARRRRPPARHGAHHVKTLDALESIRRSIEARGGRVVRVQLDRDMRASLRAGRRTQKGDVYEVMPDAVVTIEMPSQSRLNVAVEYVTSKYTDADIRAKHQAFVRKRAHAELREPADGFTEQERRRCWYRG